MSATSSMPNGSSGGISALQVAFTLGPSASAFDSASSPESLSTTASAVRAVAVPAIAASSAAAAGSSVFDEDGNEPSVSVGIGPPVVPARVTPQGNATGADFAGVARSVPSIAGRAFPIPADDVQIDLLPVSQPTGFSIGKLGVQRAVKITNADAAIARKNEVDAHAAYEVIAAHVRGELRRLGKANDNDVIEVSVNVIQGYALVTVNGEEREAFCIDESKPEVKAALETLNKIQLSMGLITSANTPRFSGDKALGNTSGPSSFIRSTERLKKLKNMTFKVFESEHLDAVLDLKFPKPEDKTAQALNEARKAQAKKKITDRLANAQKVQEAFTAKLAAEISRLERFLPFYVNPADEPNKKSLERQIAILNDLKHRLEADVFETCMGLCFEAPEAIPGESASKFQERRVAAGKEFHRVVEEFLVAQDKCFYSSTGWGTGALVASEKEYALQIAQMALTNQGDKVIFLGDRKMAQASFVEHAIVRHVVDFHERLNGVLLLRYRNFSDTRGLSKYLDKLSDNVREIVTTDFLEALNTMQRPPP